MAAPLGNQNAVKAKRWQQAIDRALEKRSKAAGIAELDRLAEEFLDTVLRMGNGENPSVTGYKELGDRLDGRSGQEITGADGGPLVIIQAVAHDESV